MAPVLRRGKATTCFFDNSNSLFGKKKGKRSQPTTLTHSRACMSTSNQDDFIFMKEMLNYALHCMAVSKSDFCVYRMCHKCCGIKTGLSLIVAAVGDAGLISCLIPWSSAPFPAHTGGRQDGIPRRHSKGTRKGMRDLRTVAVF